MKKIICILLLFVFLIPTSHAANLHENLAKAIEYSVGEECFVVQVMYGEMLLNRIRSEEHPDSLVLVCYSLGIKVRKTKADGVSKRAASVALLGLDYSYGALNAQKLDKKSIPQVANGGMLLYDWYFY